MLNKCQQCGKEFEAKRADAQFCSDKCRKALSRTDKSDKDVGQIISDTTPEIKSDKFINHITGEEHKITEISRTGLNYDLTERSDKLKLEKKRCPGCGEPTWFGCAECGKL